ncbi:hypothetical protein DM860_004261 [Cuscuta australis]|uniref:Uncharacterized protein n=1 Tax=Cuscuta australis TaxID=267555 RepID=A0A328E896_9ASTE|nr:hypothetical protein DM860_004261 [Cuscuta australis]
MGVIHPGHDLGRAHPKPPKKGPGTMQQGCLGGYVPYPSVFQPTPPGKSPARGSQAIALSDLFSTREAHPISKSHSITSTQFFNLLPISHSIFNSLNLSSYCAKCREGDGDGRPSDKFDYRNRPATKCGMGDDSDECNGAEIADL